MNKLTEHSFSVELKSGQSVRRMSYSDNESSKVLFEGILGKLESAMLLESVMLEITGQNGILRLDITRQEIEKCLASISGTREQH